LRNGFTNVKAIDAVLPDFRRKVEKFAFISPCAHHAALAMGQSRYWGLTTFGIRTFVLRTGGNFPHPKRE
jgi:hypothetical protein